MSSVLYALGHWAARARVLVLLLWIALLAVLGGSAALFGKGANAPITIPGTESQEALVSLSHTFPQVSGAGANIIVAAAPGAKVTDSPYKELIQAAEKQLTALRGVASVRTPFSELAPGGLSPDSRAALLTVMLDSAVSDVAPATTAGIRDITAEIRAGLPAGAATSYGGDVFSTQVPGVSATEAIGVLVAFVVLFLTLGSLLAAGMPLLIAILGVGVAMAGLFAVTAFVDLTSTTPMLALMLGLAVGIDYTLFIVSRHQQQLRQGLSVRESIARATATSGSAVVFAGLTVIIALVGLGVAGIPFLTALGVAAACGVGVAVLISLTLTPALLSFAGLRILSKKARRQLSVGAADASAGGAAGAADAASGAAPSPASRHKASVAERFFSGWAKIVTKRPLLTIIAVIVALGAATLPALQLRLALPNATSLPKDDPARVTYELTGKYFGEGFNGPLLLTCSIISSTDPLGLVADLKSEIERVPGVADVPLATPNQQADTVIIQVVPTEGPHAESTTELVNRLRTDSIRWEKKYDVRLLVTGFTAVGIDVSAKLLQALIPFAILVVGLSLILLAMVFRSVWVPLKATIGYLLSVGVAFGAVVAVFQNGLFAEQLHVYYTGPVLSFMPIILMGVLFGLAMDYEVFLVSRMREEWVHGAAARTAIQQGFVGSAKVVTAAALIMFAVFAAFVPEGDPSIKVIALGLAVGVFVDAFIVRMTLVPAVLAVLGERAWWMPAWLGRYLPSFDVEGEGLTREIAHENWPPDAPHAVLAGSGVRTVVRRLTGRLTGRITRRFVRRVREEVAFPDVRLHPGEVLRLDPQDPNAEIFARVISGRAKLTGGTMKVLGFLLPERARSVRARAAWADTRSLSTTLYDHPQLLVLDLQEFGAQGLNASLARGIRETLSACPVPLLVVLGSSGVAQKILPTGLVLRDLSAAAESEVSA